MHTQSLSDTKKKMKTNTDLKVLIDVGNFDEKIGASNDIIDIIRYSPKQVQYYITGNYSKQLLDNIITKRVIHTNLKPIERDKRNLVSYFFSVVAWFLYLRSQKINAVHINYCGWINSLIIATKINRITLIGRAGYSSIKSQPAVRFFDYFVANSEAQASNLLSSIYKNRVKILGDLINVDRLVATNPSAHNTEKIELLYVGQINERKGIHRLLEAFTMLPGELKDKITCKIVGGNWDEPSEFMLTLKNTFKDENIQFLGHQDDIAPLIQKTDIMVIPSLSEARPRVILEAMYFGIFIIASDVGGIPSIINHNENGVLVQPDNAKALCSALAKYIDAEDDRKRMSENARLYFENNLDPKETVLRYLSVYRISKK